MSSRFTYERKKSHILAERRLSQLPPQAFYGFQKFYHLLSPILEQPVNEAIMSEIIWTEEEMCIRMKDFEKGSGLPFWEVLVSRVCSSIAGQFINEFNNGQPANQLLREIQLDAAKITLMDPANGDEYETKNNIVDDMMSLVTKIIQSQGDKTIHFKTFLSYLDMLRLCDARIGYFDKHLIRLNTLQVLVLSGNLIEQLEFDYLPESLRVLELHNNLISKIEIYHEIAPQLVYLGLSSNCFSDNSIMEGLPFLYRLCVFDLSDNNFSSFSKVAEIIRHCPYLECICLKGNPLSTVASYKEIIKVSSPKLHQLDGIPLTYEADRESSRKLPSRDYRKSSAKKEKEKKVGGPKSRMGAPNALCYSAELRIYVFRMMGIPKPYSKNKKYKGYFQFEVQLPLLDQRLKVQKKCRVMFELLKQCGLAPSPNEFPLPTEEPKGDESIVHKIRESMMEDTIHNHRTNDTLSVKEDWETEYEEYLANDEQVPDACCIHSEKIRWAPTMKPNGPIAVIPVSIADLGQLRYTLRSVIILRLYHYEASKDDSYMEKKLIAKISVPAQEPHWREDYCSYEWNAKQPQIAVFHPTAVNVKYPTGSKGRSRSKSSITCTVPTCHLGIGLNRIG